MDFREIILLTETLNLLDAADFFTLGASRPTEGGVLEHILRVKYRRRHMIAESAEHHAAGKKLQSLIDQRLEVIRAEMT
jgi:hypothetical protein